MSKISTSWHGEQVAFFSYEKTEAQVIETYGNRQIEIHISGKHRLKLSSIIIKELDELNNTFKRLRVTKKIPCNCDMCLRSDESHLSLIMLN